MNRAFLSIPSLPALALLAGLSACSPTADLSAAATSSSTAATPGGGSSSASTLGSGLASTSNDKFDLLDLPLPSRIPLVETDQLPAGSVAGSSFRTELGPDNVTANGAAATFDPHFAPDIPRREREVAWAMYMLNLRGQETSTEGFDLRWSQAPAQRDVWVGLAHWGEDRWIWRRLHTVEDIPVPTSSPYVRQADGALACVLLTLGEDPSTLERISTRGDNNAITPPGGLANADAFLGTNLARVRDWNSAVIFTDAFRHARLWTPQRHPYDGEFDTGEELHVAPDGHITHLEPGQAAAAIVLNRQAGIHPAGTYTLLYDGDGEIDVRGEGEIKESYPNRVLIDLTPGNGLTTIRIVATNPADPVRNMRLILPGFEQTAATQPFHPDFLASLEPFNVIRFMDWGVTNETTVSNWTERSAPGVASFAMEKGVPIETMVALCNELGADMWYCIPHLADDDYVRKATTLIRDTLDPSLRLHLEYSNEVWNWVFDQSRWAHDEGLARGYEHNLARFRFYADRTKEILQIGASVFANDPDRLVRVVATQSANPWVGTTIMDWPATDPVYQYADVLAVAPYFGGAFGNNTNVNTTLTWTVDQLLDECDLDSDYRQTNDTGVNADNAESRGLELVAYEGGQHLVGVEGNQNNQTLTDLFFAANAHPRMRDIYLNDLRRWDTEGGKLFMAFTHIYEPSKWGAWGMLESLYQDRNTAPKWLGVMDWKAEKSTETGTR
ncbi:MAG: hypothetical protein CMJ94_12320 [Planctomycetes bacterium]|nr:hypothetical protein [Planctomycetota bacterium]